MGGEGWYGQTWIDTQVDPPPQDRSTRHTLPSPPCARSVLGELGAVKRPQTPVRGGEQGLSHDIRDRGVGTGAGEVLRRNREGFLQDRILGMSLEG